VPTALVATEEFAALAAAERDALGLTALPIVIVAHPFGDQPAAAIQQRAASAADGVVAALTKRAVDLTAEEAAREFPQPRSGVRTKPIFAADKRDRDPGGSRRG
jgi:hypothetical protein